MAVWVAVFKHESCCSDPRVHCLALTCRIVRQAWVLKCDCEFFSVAVVSHLTYALCAYCCSALAARLLYVMCCNAMFTFFCYALGLSSPSSFTLHFKTYASLHLLLCYLLWLSVLNLIKFAKTNRCLLSLRCAFSFVCYIRQCNLGSSITSTEATHGVA